MANQEQIEAIIAKVEAGETITKEERQIHAVEVLGFSEHQFALMEERSKNKGSQLIID